MRFSDAVAALDARTNYERTGRLVAPTLDRMRALVDLLAHPERGYPAIHVTGTNGKTTVARAAAEVLRALDLGVATYTSPHVSSIRERFLFDAQPIPEDDFTDAWRELAPYLQHFDRQGSAITWFEAATALAFIWFADKAVDAAVIEVGMGGTWDATNVIDADVAVITEVGVDHPVLGDTPEEIAREKAGVIKPGAVVVSARQSPGVLAVLRARCDEVGADLRVEGEAFELERASLALGGQQVAIRLGDDRYGELFVPLFGEHMARDVVLGAAAARALTGDVALAADVLGQGLASIATPGRMEVAHHQPLVTLDGAHNPSSAAALAEAMAASFQWDRLRLVVSIMDDKDLAGTLSPLVALADEVIVCRNHSPRAGSLDRVAGAVRALGKEPQIVASVADAVSVAIERSEDADAVLVAGSLYTVGEARAKLVAS